MRDLGFSKNSPKFFRYIFALSASTTVTNELERHIQMRVLHGGDYHQTACRRPKA